MRIKIAYYIGGTRFIDRIIRLWSRSSISHCEIVFDELCCSSSPRDRGVRCKIIDLNNGKWEVVEYEIPIEENPFIWFRENNGKRYSYGTIINFIVKIFPKSSERYICTESILLSLGIEEKCMSPSEMYTLLHIYRVSIFSLSGVA